MSNKNDKTIQFDMELNWLVDKKGILSAPDAEGTLHVATPPAFGGKGKPWTPEHLLLGAISGCFMTTFLAIAEKTRVSICRFNCSIIGKVKFSEGKYQFASIDLYPKIFIADKMAKEKAKSVLTKTHKYCIITNSVNVPITYNYEVIVEELWLKNSTMQKA